MDDTLNPLKVGWWASARDVRAGSNQAREVQNETEKIVNARVGFLDCTPNHVRFDATYGRSCFGLLKPVKTRG